MACCRAAKEEWRIRSRSAKRHRVLGLIFGFRRHDRHNLALEEQTLPASDSAFGAFLRVSTYATPGIFSALEVSIDLT